MKTLLTIALIVGPLLLIVFIAYTFIKTERQSRNAKTGLKLIEDSNINGFSKMQLLLMWTSPYASTEQLNWLIKSIKRLEKGKKQND